MAEKISGKSFVAKLQCNSPEGLLGVDYSRGGVAESGWLLAWEDSNIILELRFDFIEEVGDRLHYNISAASGRAAGHKLGISRNGYLGLYDIAEVTDYWKLEVIDLPSEPGQFDFFWRDPRGYRVGALWQRSGNFFTDLSGKWKDLQPYLNVDKGQVIEFRATILRYL